MSGLFSIFNSDAVKKLVIYKGGIPANYGGRSASVLDVTMGGDQVDEFHAKLSAGLITSKLALEIPVLKNKLTAFLAGRSSYFSVGKLHDRMKEKEGAMRVSSGMPMAKASPNQDFYFFGTDEYWYDVNGKLVWKVNDDNTLYLTGFFSRDQGILIGMTKWGNRAGSLRFNHQFTPKLQSDTSIIYSEYYTDNKAGIYIFHSWIKTSGFKQKLSWYPVEDMTVTFGGSMEYQDFNHGTLEDTSERFGKFMPPMHSLENALFAGTEYKILPSLTAYFGLRYSFFYQLGAGDSFIFDEITNEPLSSKPYSTNEAMKYYHKYEPRFSLSYVLNNQSSLKFTYNRSAQYLRLMTNSMQETWYDIWMPCTQNIPPMTTDQVALGYFLDLFNHQYHFSAETYYKDSQHAADFEDGLHNYLVDNLEAYVATGKGRAYGLELMFKKAKGRFNGWISYSVGRSENKIDVINKGEWYPSKFDKTHDFTAFISYEPLSYYFPGHKLYISALFLYSTGNAITLAEGYYYVSGIPFPYWEGRNRYRLPAYHRLDFGLKYETHVGRNLKTSLELSFYNVYNRRNVNAIGYRQGGGKVAGQKAIVDGGTSVFEPYGSSFYGFRPSFLLTVEY